MQLSVTMHCTSPRVLQTAILEFLPTKMYYISLYPTEWVLVRDSGEFVYENNSYRSIGI